MKFSLETRRLLLRAFKDDDVQAFAAYRSDPAVAKYQSWYAPYPVNEAILFVIGNKNGTPGVPGDWYQIAIERRECEQLIGDCVFHVLADDPQQAEIGFTLAGEHQGQGYATEAVSRLLDYLFGELKLHRVTAICDVRNSRSMRLMERLGMRREAHFVENIWFKGAWGSEYVYAILRREWMRGKR